VLLCAGGAVEAPAGVQFDLAHLEVLLELGRRVQRWGMECVGCFLRQRAKRQSAASVSVRIRPGRRGMWRSVKAVQLRSFRTSGANRYSSVLNSGEGQALQGGGAGKQPDRVIVRAVTDHQNRCSRRLLGHWR
jgi:hypothetical protein